MLKPTTTFADFWLSTTHAVRVVEGHEALIWTSGEDSCTPWVTSQGTQLLVYTSSRGELINLHNASEGHADHLGASNLPEWPWRLLLDDLPPATSGNRRAFSFPAGKATANAAA